jgi:hypothetical protein
MKAKLIRQGAMDKTYFVKSHQVESQQVIADPSLRKMKEEIQQRDSKNQELNDEIKRLKGMVKESLDGSEVNKDLLNELKIKEEMMAKREEEIGVLVSEKQQMEGQKQELMAVIESMKQ